MTSLNVSKGNLPHTVDLPRSKSYANRALIVGALRESTFTVTHLPDSDDVNWLLRALEQCGLKITKQGGAVTILNHFPACEGTGGRVSVGEGGTTARFFASMLLRGKSPYTLVLGGRLKDRPWGEFINFVQTFGGKAELQNDELRIQGPLSLPRKVEIDCSRTTQFASGLLLAFGDMSEIVPTKLSSSKSYWDMSLAVRTQERSFAVPLDWSGASYPLAFGALNQQIFFPGLRYDPLQSDAKFFDLLRDLEAIQEDEEGVSVFPMKKPHPVDLDVSDCLDLVPALVFLLAHVEGEHQLRGVDNLIHKESDRLSELMNLLSKFGRKSFYETGTLVLQGRTERIDGSLKLEMPKDHRMVMTAALFLRHHCGGEVSPVEAVSKSYPRFFDLLM